MRITQSFKATPFVLLLAVAAAATACGFLLSAQPALALCPVDDPGCGGGGTTTHIVTNTLTVTKTSGTVTSTPAGIDCGTDCTATSNQTVTCSGGDCTDPDPNGWTTFTLSATGGPSGYSPLWGGCASVSANQCTVTADADKTVSLSWIDTTNPSVSLSVPSAGGRVGPVPNISASASDNAGVAKVEFRVNGVLKATDTTAPYSATLDLSGLADGSSVTFAAWAYDTSGRVSVASTTKALDKSVGLSVGSVPAFTNAATVPLTIGTDSDASIACGLSGAATLPTQACAGSYSPISAASPDGSYTYSIAATDAVGNVASTTRSFVLDRTLPALAFTDGPTEGQLVGTSSIGLSFSEVEANPNAPTCTLDGSPVPCAAGSPVTLAGLTNGSHAFTVDATDKAGNERTITRNFAVSLPSDVGAGGNAGAGGSAGPGGNNGNAQPDPLAVSLKAAKQRALKKKKLVLTFTANRAFTASGSFKLGRKVLGHFSRSVQAGRHTVTVKLSKKALAALRKALRHKKTATLALKLTYTDATGATAPASGSVAIRR